MMLMESGGVEQELGKRQKKRTGVFPSEGRAQNLTLKQLKENL